MTKEFVTHEELRRKRTELAQRIVTERYARGAWPSAETYRDYWTIRIGTNTTQGLGETEGDAWIDLALSDARLKVPAIGQDEVLRLIEREYITEDERDAFVRKAIAARGVTIRHGNIIDARLGYIGSYSGMTAQYSLQLMHVFLKNAYEERNKAYEAGVKFGRESALEEAAK